jgi:hypothetical protein
VALPRTTDERRVGALETDTDRDEERLDVVRLDVVRLDVVRLDVVRLVSRGPACRAGAFAVGVRAGGVAVAGLGVAVRVAVRPVPAGARGVGGRPVAVPAVPSGAWCAPRPPGAARPWTAGRGRVARDATAVTPAAAPTLTVRAAAITSGVPNRRSR